MQRPPVKWIGLWDVMMSKQEAPVNRHLPSVVRIMGGARLHTVKAGSSQLDFT